MNLSAIDHVGIAVEDLDAAVERYHAQFGVRPTHRERIVDQGVEEVLIEVDGSFIQLLGALGPNTPVGRYLQRHGPGLHHVAYRVENLEAALGELSARGVRLIDEQGRAGSRGTLIAFLHPAATGGVLTELVQTPAT